jgi:cell division protein FtsZ
MKAESVPLPLSSDAFDTLSLPPPSIIVMGVGSAGGAVVNLLMKHRQPHVVHMCVDTDAQALNYYNADLKLLMERRTKHGFCHASPDYGRRAVEESRDEIQEIMAGADLLLLVGGMGGATATGGIPVIAQIAHEAGTLTVNVVTNPFGFEGRQRSRQAIAGISDLERDSTTTVVVPMNGVLEMVASDTTLRHAYEQADHTIREITRAIINSIMVPGLINVNFSDVRAVLADRGPSAMGIGVGRGPNRAVEAAQAALRCPLLGNAKMGRASGMLGNIAGHNLELWELQDCMDVIYRPLNDEALVCFGDTPNPNLQDAFRVTLIAAGIGPTIAAHPYGHTWNLVVKAATGVMGPS